MYSYKYLGSTICLFLLMFTGMQAEASESDESMITARFVPPPDWKLAESNTLSPNVKIMVIGKGKGEFPPSINLATEFYAGTLKDYLKIVKSLNVAKGNAWQDLGKIQTEAGEGSLSQVDTRLPWGDVRMLHTILLKDGIIYIVTAAAPKDEFSSWYQAFFNAMRTLQIDDAEKVSGSA